MRSMRSQHALLLLCSSMAIAQDTRSLIIPSSGSSTFPACAVGCTVLQSAQTACQPSASTQLNFENCFCQSPTLAALYTTPDALCTAECPTSSDRVLLQQWYTQFCQIVGQGVDPLTVAPTQAGTTTLVTVTSTNPSIPSATITGSGVAQGASDKEQGSWISNHWQWILMLGILAVGFGLITWGAVWLKRRHQRKVDQRRSQISGFPTESEKREGARSATPDLWGPHQHMHATKGWEYHQEEVASSIPSSSDRHERRRSQRDMGPRERALRDSAMDEAPSRPGTHRKKSLKGKSRDVDSIQEHGSRRESRSRSHRRRDRGDG